MSSSVFRWAARVWSLASLLFLAAFIFGTAEPAIWPTVLEWIGLAFFPGGVIVGLLVAWRREWLGGAITVLSLAGFYAWHYAVAAKLAAGPWFALVAAPGALFLMAAWLERATLRRLSAERMVKT